MAWVYDRTENPLVATLMHAVELSRDAGDVLATRLFPGLAISLDRMCGGTSAQSAIYRDT